MYVGNNPIILTDPDGMRIEGDTTAVKRLVSDAKKQLIKNRKNNLDYQIRLQAVMVKVFLISGGQMVLKDHRKGLTTCQK